jgi:hypothetical protein
LAMTDEKREELYKAILGMKEITTREEVIDF